MNDPYLKLCALRRMMDLLATSPEDDFLARLQQSLQALCEMVPLTAAAIVWQPADRAPLKLRWPEASPLSEEPLAGEPDGAWFVTPMQFAGATMGRLWVIPHPDRPLDDHDCELLLLATGQMALACHAAGLSQELTTHNEQRSVLLERLVQVNEECRRHVARELHDEVSQSLAALIFQVDTAQATLNGDAGPAVRHLETLRRGLVQLVDEVQRLVLELRPALLEQKGLLEALRWYGQQYLQPVGAHFHVSGGQCAPHLPSLTRLTLYRIGQEAIANAARHSGARNVWLEIVCRDNLLSLTVRDDGRGFDPDSTLAHPQGMKGIGLINMQERALLLGGALRIASAPGRGTCIQVRAPLGQGCRL
jgi:signal transduction histidine kinase